ncbi:hypothetical protein A2U01_0093280, partial [Trifolium medium]|nr:hypothetical protein [Trifolium medium]
PVGFYLHVSLFVATKPCYHRSSPPHTRRDVLFSPVVPVVGDDDPVALV